MSACVAKDLAVEIFLNLMALLHGEGHAFLFISHLREMQLDDLMTLILFAVFFIRY